MRLWVASKEQQPPEGASLALTIFGILALRMVLEPAVYLPGRVINPTNFLLHFPFFYMSLFLCLTLMVACLTRSPLLGTWQLLTPGLAVIWLPPLIDFAASGFGNAPIQRILYITGDWNFLWRQFLTFYAGMSKEMSTLGLKTEILLIYAGLTFLVYLKTRSFSKALVALFLTHLIVFLHGTMPSALFNLRDVKQELERMPAIPMHQTRANLFLMVICLELVVVFTVAAREKVKAVLANARPFRVIHYWGMLTFGLYLGHLNAKQMSFFSDVTFLMGIATLYLAVLALWLSSVFLNDVYDLEGDRLSNPERPIGRGALSRKEGIGLALGFAALSLIAATTLYWGAVALLLAALGISVVYSMPPLRLKRYPLISTGLIAVGSLLMIALGFSLFGHATMRLIGHVTHDVLKHFPERVVAMVLVCFTLSFNTKDLKDIAGDRLSGNYTLPVLLGITGGKWAIGLLSFASYLAVPFFLQLPELWMASALGGFLTFVLILRPKASEPPIFLIYYLFMVLVAWTVLPQPGILFQ